MGDGEFMPIGTIPTSSGRREGEGVVRFGPEESDVAGRRVTASELVWAEVKELKIRAINRNAPQKGRLFLKGEIWAFRSAKPIQLLLRSCMTPSFVRLGPRPKDSGCKVS